MSTPALRSIDEQEGEQGVGTKVLVKLHWIDRDEEIVRMSFVKQDGELVHDYKFTGSHLEITQYGHAFVVIWGDGTTEMKGNETNTKKRKAPVYVCDLEDRDIICSFIPSSGPEECRIDVNLYLGPKGLLGTKIKQVKKPRDEMRIILDFPDGHKCILPDPKQGWINSYDFIVPPVPSKSHFLVDSDVFYVWGDLCFPCHGNNGSFEITKYMMNQIVPQIMTGTCLCGNSDDGTYTPAYGKFEEWVMQAQYYWQDQEGGSHAKCGELIPVHPGEKISTVIEYAPPYIDVTITCGPGRISHIRLDRPFLDDPSQFQSWQDFFEKAAAKANNKGAYAFPGLCVEYKGAVSPECLNEVCPFRVTDCSFPGLGHCRRALKERLYLVEREELQKTKLTQHH